jgi:transcriptional regulator with XRE-family HTH domain
MGHDRISRKARGEGDDGLASRFGAGVRAARATKGWTQVQLALAAGLATNTVARVERGELGVSLDVALRLCAALGVTVEATATSPRASMGDTKPRGGRGQGYT